MRGFSSLKLGLLACISGFREPIWDLRQVMESSGSQLSKGVCTSLVGPRAEPQGAPKAVFQLDKLLSAYTQS